MKRLVIFLMIFTFMGTGCHKPTPRVKDPNAERIKIEKQMQAQQELIKNLKLPNPNAIKPPPAPGAPVANMPKAPSAPQVTGKPALKNIPAVPKKTNEK